MKELVIEKFKKNDIEKYEKYEKLIIKSFDKSITDCHNLFINFCNLKEVVIEDWNNVTNASGMFWNCSNLTKVTFPDVWNKVTDVGFMFCYCYKLTKVTLPDNWNNVINTSCMFYYCCNLEEVNLPADWNNVTDISSILSYCNNLTVYYNGTTNLYEECDLPEVAKVINLTESTMLDLF